MDIPKISIRRIADQGARSVFFTGMIGPDQLPPWRMIVQDLRTDDYITSFRQIPPTAIDNGYLKNIPYLSFRINRHTEMNVYGDPQDPVCLEFGVYEHGDAITRFKKIIRAYLAGILENRAQIAALYALNEKGDQRRVGNLCFRVLPPCAPDAYGGWWLSVYEPDRLDQARLTDAAYQKITRPFNDINTRAGELRQEQAMHHQNLLTHSMMQPFPIGGFEDFCRDKMGTLKVLFHPLKTSSIPVPPPAS